jgi:hypothetical protein
MRYILAVRKIQSLMALLLIIVGLLFWLFRPVKLPPVDQLRIAASVAWFLLVIAASAGVAAMATIQFWKALFQPRSAFHSSELEALFGESLGQVFGLAGPTLNNLKTDSASKPARLDYLLDNPTEVVMGQLRSTADYILLRPKGFEEALFLLAGAAGKSAVGKYLDAETEQPAIPSSDNTTTSLGRSNEALVGVRFFVEQHLNLIHVRLKERWRRRVRIAAVAVAGLAGLLTVSLSNLGPAAKVSAVFAAVVWGGFFSWLARDIVALIERRRT